MRASNSSNRPFTAPLSPALKKNLTKSNNNESEIHVQFGAPSYTSGEVVTGVVNLNCKIPFSPHSIVVKIKGIERLWWQNTKVETINKNGRKETKTITEDINSDKKFFIQTIELEAPQSPVGVGQYSFPFLYKLPTTLPASFYEEGGDKQQGDAYSCKILYKVKAAVYLTAAEKPFLKETSWIVVNEAIDTSKKLQNVEAKKALVAKKGSVHAKVWMDKHAHTPGDTALSKVKVNNSSVKPNKFVRMSVTKHLDLKANGAEKHLQQNVYSQEFPGLTENFYGVMWLPFHLPVSMLPSVSLSANLKSHYLVNIEVDVPTTSEMSLSIPIFIRVPDTFFSGMQVQPPPGPVPTTIAIRPPWQADNSAQECQECRKSFSLVARRHHCRHCGRLLCANCCSMESTLPRLGLPSAVRVCTKCYPEASKGGTKKASSKKHMEEFYKLHPPPLAIKAPPPPTKEEAVAGVLKQVETAENDCKAQNWSSVLSRKTPLLAFIESNRHHLDNAFVDDVKARYTICETEANRAIFDEQVKALVAQLEKLGHQAETASDLDSFDATKSVLRPLLDRAQTGPYATTPVLQELVPVILGKMKQWESNYAKGQTAAAAQAKLKAIQQQLENATKEAGASHFKNAKASLSSAGNLIAEVEASADFSGLDFVPSALIQFKAQITASRESMTSAKVTFKISQIKGVVASVDGMIGQSKIEDALKQVEQANAFLSKLAKYSNFAIATSFLSEGPALISGASERCSHAKTVKEVEDKKSNFNTRIIEAENCVLRDQYDDAKQKLEQARNIIDELHHNFHSSQGVEEFVHKGKERIDTIYNSISEKQFSKELTKKKDMIDSRLFEAENHLKNDRFDSVTEKLDEAKAVLADLAVEPFSGFAGTRAIADKATERINKLASDAYSQKHTKEARNKMEWISTLKGNVQSCIQRAEYDNAVAKIEETRTKLAELDNPSLNSLEQVGKFISDTLAALVDLEGTISAQKFERHLRDKKDMISNRFTQADNYLKRDSWDSVAEMVEEARGFINELSDPQYAAVGGLADYVAQSLAKAQKFLDDSFSQRYGKESRNKMDYIKTLKGNADRQLGLSQWDQSLSSIESVRTELEKLNVEPLNQLPDVIKFLAEIPPVLDQLEANISSGRHGKEARDKMDYIKTLKGNADRQLGLSQWDQALSSVETVREHLTKLNVEPLNQLPDVIKFLAEVPLALDQLAANVSSGRHGKEARDKMDYIKTLKGNAERQLGYSQWDQCLGSVESTREAIAKLNVEPLNQLPDVVKFLSEVPLALDEMVEKVSSGRYGKEAKDKMDYINTLKSGAKEHIRLEQWDQGVGKIEDCRTRTSALDAAPYNTIPSVVTFLQEVPPQLDAMLEQITSGRYAKDAKNKMEYLKTLRGAAAQNIKVDQWDQALGKIEDIRTRMQELENEPFNKLPAVTAFLEEYPPALDKMVEEITQAKYGKQAKNTMEYLGTLRGIATQNVKNEQWDQAIGKIEEIRTKMQEIDTEPFNTQIPAVITFLKDFPPTLDKLSDDIVAGKFGKQARNTIDWLKTLRSTAQQNVKVDQWDQATGKIEEARTKLQDLEAEPYNTLPNVIEFMKEYPASLDKLSEDIVAAKFGKEARNKMEYLGTLRTIATQNVKNTQWDQAIDKIEDARTRLQDLDTEPYNTKLPNVIEFLKTYPATLDKLEEEITAGKFGKEARNKMEWLGTLRGVAAQHAKVDQWDQALGKIEEARTKLADLDTEPYNTKIPAVIEFLKEYPATLTKIEDDIIVAKFTKDARSKMEWINTLKGIAAQNISNSQWDQALDKIEEARSKLQDLDVEPFNTKLPAVIQFLKDIPPVLEKQVDDITVAKYSKEARDRMDWIKTLKGIAQQNIQNEQWGQAVDKIEEARTKLQDLDKEPFNTDKFPTVVPFLKEMQDEFTKFEEDIVIKKYSKEAKSKMDWVGTLKGIAADNMEKEQWDQSSGKLEEARAILQDLSQEPFTKVPAVVAFLEEMPPKLNEIEDQIVQRKFSKVAKGKMEWLGTLKGVAEQFLEQEQWDRVLDQVEQARGIILEISQEPFTKLEVVNNFVSDYAPKLEKIVQDVVERKFSKVAKNKMEWANTLLGIAQQNAGNDQFEQAVDKLEEARNVVLELGQEPFTMLPAVEAFVATKNVAIAALEQQIIEKKFSKIVKNKIEWIGTLKGVVQQHVKVDQFDQAVGKIEEVREKLYEISQEPYDKIAFVVEFVQESTLAFNKIEEEIISTKISKAANNKMDWVKTLKGVAEDNVEKDQWDQAVGKIEEARTIIYELSQETYLSIPAIGAFVANMEPIFYGLEEKMADKKFRKEAQSKKEWLDTLRRIATERSQVDQWDQALDKLEEARQIAYILKQEPFSKLSDIVAFATQTEAALDTLEKDIASAKFGKSAKNKMDYAKTLKGIAVDNVSKDQWDQASQKIEEIRDALGELLQLPFSALPAVSEFTASIVPEIDAIEKELNEKRFAKVAKGRMEWAQTNHQIAKQSLDVDKWDDTFAKIELARDVLYELSQEPYTQLAAVVAFVEQITPQLTALHNSTIEKKFAKEAKGKMEYVGTLTSVASQFAGNDQFDQSLGKIEEARDVISVLKQEPYNVLEVVNNFVGPAAEALTKIEDKIREIKYNKEIKNKSEWVGTLLGVSKQNIDAEQWGQSIDKIEQIRTILSDLQQDPDFWASPIVKTFVAETGPKVEALEREIVDRQFGKELKNKMEWVNTLKGVATQCAANDQWEQALEKVEAALQIVFELSQEPYVKLPVAGEFCENIKPAFEKIQTEVAEKKISKAARNKMEYASTLKNIASDNQDKEQWDQALDKVESSRQVLFELSMEPYTILPYVQSFISETTTALDKIDQLIVENKFAKVARNKMEWVNTLINVAKDFVSKDSWDMGLAKVEEARQILSELGQEPFTKLPAVVAFVTENTPSLDKIEQSVVEAKFAKQTRSKIDRVATLKHQVKTWIERENWDTAFQDIENARQVLFELNAEPFCKLAVATEFVKETTPLLDQFEEDILHKKLSKDTRNKMEWVGTLIGTSNNMLFREHWDAAHEKLYEARDVLEALNREPYTRINGVTAFVAEKTKVIEEGEQQIIENKFNKEAKNRVQYFGTLKQVANDNVHKEQWDQALDKVEVARQVVSDLNEEPYNKLPNIIVFLNSSPLQQLEQIEQQVIERKFAKVVKGKIEWCNTLKGVARDCVSKDQWDQALDKIEELRSILLELSEEPFSKLPASTAVVATETPEANKLEQQIFERKFAKEVQGKMEWARTLLNVANQCYEKDQWDQALGKIEEGREIVTALNEEPYNQLATSPKFVQELTTGFDNTSQRIIEAKFSKEAKNKQEYVGTLRDVANQNIQNEQWDQALDKIEAARAVIFELQQEPFSQIGAIANFTQTASASLDKADQTIIEAKFTKDAFNKMEWVGTLSRIAADNSRVEQWDQATGKLEEARQMIYVLSQEPYNKLATVTKFIENSTATLNNIEQQIIEKKFAKESKNKIDYASTLKNTASSYLFREQWDGALEKIEEAKAVVSELSQEPYSKLPAVVKFTEEITPALDKFIVQVNEQKFGKEAKNKLEYLSTLKNVANDFMSKEQWDQALDNLEKARTLLSELSEEPYSLLPVVQNATKDTSAALDKIDQQIVERKFNKVAKGKMEWAGTLKSTAKQSLDVDQWDAALSKLEDMRSVLDELTEDPFSRLSVVATFVEKERPQLAKIEQQIIERKFSKEVQSKIDWLGTIIQVANQCLEKEQWDQAVNHVEEGRSVLAELAEEPFNKLVIAGRAVSKSTPLLDKIEQQITENKFGKEARNKQEYLGTLKSVALDFLQKEQFDSALHQVETAKQLISELTQDPYSKLPAVVKYAQDTLTTLNKIEQDVATTKFAKLSKDKMEYVNTLLGVATNFVQKSQFDQGTQQLEQARQALTELSEDPFDKLPVVAKFVSNNNATVAKLEQQIIETKFNKEAKNKMDYATSLKSTASSYLFREMWDEANTKIEEARTVVTELSQDPFAKLPVVTAFVAEISPNLTKVQQQVAENKFGKEARGKIEYVGTLKGSVVEFVNNAQYDQAVGKLEEARTYLSELDKEPFNVLPVVQKCVKEQGAAFDKIEQQIIEKKFLKVAKDKMSHIGTLKGVARDALNRENWDNAFHELSTARTNLVELSEEPFTKLPICVTFVEKENAELDKIEQKIVEQKFGKEAKNKMEYANTLRGVASEFSQKEQWDQAIGKIEEANNVIAELQAEPFNKLPQVNNFVQTIVQSLAKIEQQIIERKFSKQAKDKMEYSNTLKSTAATNVEHEQWDQAVEKIEACRNTVQELSEEPFNKLPHVVRFAKDQSGALDRLEQEMSEKRFAKLAKDKMDWANTLKGVANDCCEKQQWDQGFEKIEEGRKVLDELNQPPLNKISAVINFIGNFTAEFEKIENTILAKKVGKAAQDKLSWITTCLNSAGQSLSISGYDKALGEIEKAREALLEIDAAPFNKLQNCVTACKDLRDRASRLEAQTQEKRLNSSFYDKIAYINTLLDMVPTFINQGNNGRATEELEKARGKIEELAEPPFRVVAAFQVRVKELRKSIGQLEAKLGAEFVKKIVTDKISKAQFYLGEAESKKGTTAAVENVEKARDVVQELLEPSFKSVEQVSAALPTLQSRIAAIDKQLASTTVIVKATPGQLVSPTGPISDVFGPWVPFVESGMVSGIKPDPKVPTNTRTFIHKWNPAVDEIGRKWKKFVTTVYVEGDRLEKLYALAGRGKQNWNFEPPTEETFKVMDQLRKDISYLIDKPPEDPTGLTATIVEQYKEAAKRWKANTEHLENVSRLTDGINRLLNMRSRYLLRETALQMPTSFAKGELGELFGRTRGLHLGPIQDEVEERIRLIGDYQSTFHEGRVYGYHYDSNKEMTLLDFQMETVSRYVDMFRSEDKTKTSPDQRKSEVAGVRKALKRLEPYPQIYKVMIDKLHQEWDREFMYFQPYRYTKGCELEFWEVAAKPSPLVFDLKFLIDVVGMTPFDPVSPGTPEQSGLPFQSTASGFKPEFELPPEQEKLYAGKFVFSASGPISNTFVKAEALSNSFVLSDDLEIHSRAFWPACLGNFALGKSKLTGAPFYLTVSKVKGNCCVNRLLYVKTKIDGKEVKPLTSVRHESMAWDTSGNAHSFRNKSIPFAAVGSKVDSERNSWDNWGLGKRRLMKYLIDAGPGKHSVEFSIQFVFIGDNIWERPQYEHSVVWSSLPSHPLAVGTFDIVVPDGFAIPSSFPEPNIEAVPLSALHNFYKNNGFARIPAHLIWATQDSDWYLYREREEIIEYEEKFGKIVGVKKVIPPVYAKNYCCLIYINPEDGWKSRECVFESINIVTAVESRNWANLSNVLRDDFHGSYFEVEILPQSMIDKIPNRCTEEMRFKSLLMPF